MREWIVQEELVFGQKKFWALHSRVETRGEALTIASRIRRKKKLRARVRHAMAV